MKKRKFKKPNIHHVHVLERGKYKLVHDRFTDEMGIRRDSFYIQYNISDTGVINYHFYPPIKVIQGDYRKKNIMDTTQEYTEEEYENMLEDHKKKMEKRFLDPNNLPK